MKIQSIQVPKAKLDKIPELDRVFYFLMGHLRNEVMVLVKLLGWSSNTATDNAGEYLVANKRFYEEVMKVSLQFIDFCDGCLEYEPIINLPFGIRINSIPRLLIIDLANCKSSASSLKCCHGSY